MKHMRDHGITREVRGMIRHWPRTIGSPFRVEVGITSANARVKKFFLILQLSRKSRKGEERCCELLHGRCSAETQGEGLLQRGKQELREGREVLDEKENSAGVLEKAAAVKNHRKEGVSPVDWRQNAMLCPRKRFSDITNKSFIGFVDDIVPDDQENWKVGSAMMTNENIAKLLKENNVLMRALAERNMEVQKLHSMAAETSRQNWQLAQAHSHIQAELSLSKERLRVAQHELCCTSTALSVKTQELKEHRKLNKQNKLVQKITSEASDQTSCDTVVEASHLSLPSKACLSNRKRPQRSQSLGSKFVTNQLVMKEKDENQRKPLRKSSNAKVEFCVPNEDLFEIKDAKFLICLADKGDSKDKHSSHPGLAIESVNTVKEDVVEENQKPIKPLSVSIGRNSLGRPLRKAAQRVDSYKELPLNVKLRREE
ncbi:hypothetical protein HPP92_008395 [Vanilla planifolia]|uniref:Shugoshin C-terminal domain-containing protein n=1 Tax=Vanilla planifolia TaxID=51239 RepID=A0A835V5Z2_VANPL|nr:hypothetical protein HPP92_008395 [Vanilla planifolia]